MGTKFNKAGEVISVVQGLNDKDDFDTTPMENAVDHGQSDVIHLLSKYGASTIYKGQLYTLGHLIGLAASKRAKRIARKEKLLKRYFLYSACSICYGLFFCSVDFKRAILYTV